MRIKNYILSIPVFVVGIIIIYLLFFSSCGGIVEIYSTIFLLFILTIYLSILYIYSLTAYIIRKRRIDVKPLLTVILFIGVFMTLSYWDTNKVESKIILEARNGKAYGSLDIRLKENNEVEFIYGHIEEKCSCEGKYITKADTIIITDINKPKRADLADKYLIGDKYVIPFVNDNIETDSTKYLRITNAR
jgi:hypothetical protein